MDFELTFITRYLIQLIEEKKVPISKSVPRKVSYQDPCSLGRALGDFDSARDIFKKLPGLEFIEMRRNREDSYCCGAGGGMAILDPENGAAVGQERVKDFLKTGAEVLATSCPLCKLQFQHATKNVGKDTPVRDVVRTNVYMFRKASITCSSRS